MRTTDPTASPPAPPAPPPSPADRRALDAVRMQRVELHRATPPSTIARVQGVLHLGALLPPDVDVELTIGIDEGDAPRLCLVERMWSAQAYDNGSYLYHAHVPDERLGAAHDLGIHVQPHGRPQDRRVLATILPSSELRRAPGDPPSR